MAKLAIVTGAGRGLGREVAVELGKAGYDLAICSRTWSDLQGTMQRISGVAMQARPVDVTHPGEVADFVRDILGNHSRVDALVNCAGYVPVKYPVGTYYPFEMDRCLETNLMGPWYFMSALIPFMRTQKSGVIVNVASKAARYTVPGQSAYCASKAALVALTQTAAKECAADGLRILTVSPGGMNTAMRAKVYGDEDAAKQQSPQFVAKVIVDIIEDRDMAYLTEDVPRLRGHVKNGDDVLVWKEVVKVYEMPELR